MDQPPTITELKSEQNFFYCYSKIGQVQLDFTIPLLQH